MNIIEIPFQSPEDAWLTGLTEAIRFAVPDGFPLTEEKFKTLYQLGCPELDFKLNVGRDLEFGIWKIVGWRMGLYLVLMTQWDISLIDNENALAELWVSIMDDDPELVAATVAEPLTRELGVDIVMLGPAESAFLKRFVKQ